MNTDIIEFELQINQPIEQDRYIEPTLELDQSIEQLAEFEGEL